MQSRCAGDARRLSLLQIGALLLAAAASVATSGDVYYACRVGGTPLPGQSAVPIDAPLSVRGPELPNSAPQIAQTAIRLEVVGPDGEGRAVPAKVGRGHGPYETRSGSQVVWLITPEQPLAPDTAYQIIAMDKSALDTPHYTGAEAIDSYSFRWRRSVRPFYTGSAPWLLAAHQGSGSTDATRHIVLTFSEPMALDDLVEHLSVTDDQGVIPVNRPLSARASSPRVVDLYVARRGAGPARVRVEPGARAVTGATFVGHGLHVGPSADGADESLVVDANDPGSPLAFEFFNSIASMCNGDDELEAPQ